MDVPSLIYRRRREPHGQHASARVYVGRLVVSRQWVPLSPQDEEERLRRRPLMFKGMDG
jgi:hypothetical protein